MKHLNTIQIQKKSPLYKIIILVIVSTLMFLVSACKSGEPSDEQIEHAEKTVSSIRASLYTPSDAKLLAEKLYYGSNPDLYPGCVSGEIYLAYHSPRAFDEILKEYREGLKGTGWEPSPDYSHDYKDIDVFQAGPQTILFLSSGPLRPDLLVVPTTPDNANERGIIYFIQLIYDEPSIHKCGE